jgi:hypothetical protein
MFTRNDPARGLFNGTRAVVDSAAPDRLQLRLDTGHRLALSPDAVAGRLAHAYALTVHKAQGLTVDTSLLYGTAALCQQAGYVGMSRGRQANHLYTTLASLDADRTDDLGPAFTLLDGPDPTDVLDALADRLTRAVRHVLAVEQRPTPSARPAPEPWQRQLPGRDDHEPSMRDAPDRGRGR